MFTSSAKKITKKIIIIGGGIAGLTCAKSCLDAGFAVKLYEKRPLKLMLSGPGGIFVQRNAMKVYDRMGLRDALYQKGGQILKGGFFNAQGQPLYINDPQFIQASDLGVCLSRGALQQVLYNALPPDIVHPETEFANFTLESDRTITVTFRNGHQDRCDVLIGADGLYSLVQEQLQTESESRANHNPVYSGVRCWRGITPVADLPLNPAYSWGEYWGVGTRFGYFDVGQGMIGFYAFMNANLDQPKVAITEVKSFLLNLFRNYEPTILQIIQSLDPASIYEDSIFDRPPLSIPWGNQTITLIGDAAHPVQPNLGQGGCMAIEDAYELSRYLVKASSDELTDHGFSHVLRQFEESRLERVTKVFNASRQLGQLGQIDTQWGCWVRDKVYQLTPVWLGDLQFKWLFDYEPTT